MHYPANDARENFTREKIPRYVVIPIKYGRTDFAYDVYQRYSGVKDLIPDVESRFRPPNTEKIILLIKTAGMRLDKVTCLLPPMRKTNQSDCDSDRSSPNW